MKKVHIMTFGCQMNEHDTEQIAGLLSAIGYVRTDAPEEADMILLNTCSIREKAEHKLYSQLGHLRPLKEQKPHMVLGVCGFFGSVLFSRFYGRHRFPIFRCIDKKAFFFQIELYNFQNCFFIVGN